VVLRHLETPVDDNDKALKRRELLIQYGALKTAEKALFSEAEVLSLRAHWAKKDPSWERVGMLSVEAGEEAAKVLAELLA
jgi:hypothetical protein